MLQGLRISAENVVEVVGDVEIIWVVVQGQAAKPLWRDGMIPKHISQRKKCAFENELLQLTEVEATSPSGGFVTEMKFQEGNVFQPRTACVKKSI